MQQFRNLLRGWLGKLLLAIFILPFLFFGIEGIFTANSNLDVAISVNDAEISKREVSRAIENRRQQLKQQMGGNIDDAFLSDDLLRPQVHEGLIQRELVKQATRDEGLSVSPELVKSYIRSMPQFQGEDGQFSNARLEVLLTQANMTKAQLFETIKESLVVEQLQSGFTASAFVTDNEFQYLANLGYQKRNIADANIKANQFKDDVEISDDELQAYYEENKTNFRTPEQVKINYVAIGIENYKDDVTISEDDLRTAYEQYVNAQQEQEKRRASHILVEINEDRSKEEAKQRIEEIQSELEQGASFGELAREYSDDAGSSEQGGDLDFNGLGIFEEKFEKALFAIEEIGSVSPIVETEFGYHLIKLTEIDGLETKSFEAIKPDIEDQLASEQARKELDLAIDEMGRLAYETGDLETIADTYDIEVQTTDFFTRQGGSGIAAMPNVVETAFKDEVLQDRHNSEVIELDDGRVAVIRVKEHKPAEDLALEKVEDQIRNTITQTKAAELAQNQANKIVAMLKEGKSLEEVADEFDIAWNKRTELTRQNRALPQSVVAKAFEMPRPTEDVPSIASVSDANGNYNVIVLTEVIPGTADLDKQEMLQAKVAAAQQNGAEEFQSYVSSLEADAEIIIR